MLDNNYALVSKKGQFEPMWREVYSNKGLSKREVLNLDIVKHCKSILEGIHPMALRVTSALIVGAALINDRKAAYLLTEARESWSRLRIEMRVDSVDLPVQSNKRKHDMDITLNDLDVSDLHDLLDVDTTIAVEIPIFEAPAKTKSVRDDEHVMMDEFGEDIQPRQEAIAEEEYPELDLDNLLDTDIYAESQPVPEAPTDLGDDGMIMGGEGDMDMNMGMDVVEPPMQLDTGGETGSVLGEMPMEESKEEEEEEHHGLVLADLQKELPSKPPARKKRMVVVDEKTELSPEEIRELNSKAIKSLRDPRPLLTRPKMIFKDVVNNASALPLHLCFRRPRLLTIREQCPLSTIPKKIDLSIPFDEDAIARGDDTDAQSKHSASTHGGRDASVRGGEVDERGMDMGLEQPHEGEGASALGFGFEDETPMMSSGGDGGPISYDDSGAPMDMGGMDEMDVQIGDEMNIDDQYETGSVGSRRTGSSGSSRSESSVARPIVGDYVDKDGFFGYLRDKCDIENADVSLKKAIGNKGRNFAARAFYQTLVMSTTGVLAVEQEESFGDVRLHLKKEFVGKSTSPDGYEEGHICGSLLRDASIPNDAHWSSESDDDEE
eukprot:TRINITY_DN12143_c0_g1_i1.p1 TRINITY_DN12143_c0_g1~~TRINITY_DN12143_c0_g1_i1.p1  ORF type:complete len:606 (+),score=259.02 TRINITY_DN12143_c0_g1_i1:112-1929(+)